MQNNQNIVDQLCEHFSKADKAERDGGGELWYGELEQIVSDAIASAHAEGYREGAEKMREDAAILLETKVPNFALPNGRLDRHPEGKNSPDSAQDKYSAAIRKLPITPPQPEALSETTVPSDEVDRVARRYYSDGAKAALAAMQPAIDKAVAEERARIIAVMEKRRGLFNNPYNHAEMLKAIEQGGGDACI